jgi:NAD(P)-dependent dehydrogenase (short-subunit alcohol dehydrogenase family)
MINKKLCVVTGGTQGIGQGIALEFLEHNYFVVITARNSPKDQMVFDSKGEWKFIACDIASQKSRNALVENIMKEFGRVDVLVNNAGIAPPERKDLLEATEESYDLVMNTNLKGPYFLTQDIARRMIALSQEQAISNYLPCIINIGSISSFTSSVNRGEYCLSKAGMTMMTQLYAHRLAEFGIPVYEIQPGLIDTPMTAGVKEKYDQMINSGLLPIKRWGTPSDIGNVAITLAERKIPYSTGQILHIDGGFHLQRL